MTTTEVLQVADIIECVKTWPATMRVTLARRILETIDAPSDEECQRILEEELSEKYMP